MNKYLKLNESTESEVVFMTFLPDDYHGSPEISETFTPGHAGERFPPIPTEDDVFAAWSAAGYNAFAMNDDGEGGEEDERISFQNYGNMSLYYAVYLIIVENPSTRESLFTRIKEELDDLMYGSAEGDGSDVSPEMVVKALNDMDGILFAMYIS